MIDVFAVADLLVSYAVSTHGQAIDIIGYYGSHAQGVATDRSDLDIFYTPAEGENPPVARTVLIDGTLFDFWPITWDTLEGFATGRLRGWAFAPALVYHTKTLYCRSDAAAARLARLRQQIVDLQQPEARPQMVARALDEFSRVYTHLGKVRLALATGHLTDVRQAAWELTASVLECLALANQLFFDRAGSTVMQQLSRLQARPADLEHLMTTIATATDSAVIAAAAEALALGTREVLRQGRTSRPSPRPARDQFAGAYPEIKAGLDKVLKACEEQHPVAASSAAWQIQHEVATALAETTDHPAACPAFDHPSEYMARYQEIGLPDLVAGPFGDLREMAERVGVFDRRLRRWLRKQSVELNEYRTVKEFARSLE